MESIRGDTDTLEPGTVSTGRVNLLDPCMATDPYAVYRRLLAEAPVCQVDPGGMWAVSRYKDVRYALKHPEIFSSVNCHDLLQPEWLKGDYLRNYSLIFSDPPQHSQRRKLLNKPFSKKSVENLSPYIREIARELVNRIEDGSTFDFMEKFSFPFADRSLAHLVGIDNKHYFEKFRQWASLLENPPSYPDLFYHEQIRKLSIELNQELTGYINKCHEPLDPDTVLGNIQTHADDDKALTTSEISELLELIMLGSMQPIPHLLCRAIIHLAHNTNLLKKLVKSPEFIPSFIDELMRHSSPVHFVVRRTVKTSTLSGVTLPAGSKVVLIIAAANRDSSQFTDPEKFDLYRDNVATHIAFGSGVHTCLGIHLAKTELSIALEALLSRYQHITCPPTEKLSWFYTLFIQSVKDLPVRFYV